jgi:outer membrane protein assembly factor BamB
MNKRSICKFLVSSALALWGFSCWAGDWPMFMGNSAHSGVAQTAEVPRIRELTLAWQYELNSAVVASPVVSGQQLFVAAENGNLHALDLSTQRPLWLFHAAGGISSTPAVAQGMVYFLSRDGRFYAVDQGDGTQRWTFSTLGEHYFSAQGMFGAPLTSTPVSDPWDYFLSSPLVHGGRVYFGSSDGNVYALDAQTGALLWRFKTGGVVHSSPAWVDNKILIGSWDSALYALEADTGREIWRYQGRSEHRYSILLGIQSSPTVDQERVYVGSRDGHMYALKLADGTLCWTYDAQGSWIVATAAADEGTLYVGTSDTGIFIALDKATGKERYRFATRNWTYASAVLIANRFVGFGTMAAEFHILDKFSGALLWSFQTPERKADEFHIVDATTGQLKTAQLFASHEQMHSAMEKVKRLGAFIASPLWIDRKLILVSATGHLFVFRAP